MFDQLFTMWQSPPQTNITPRRPVPLPAMRGLPLGNLLETNQLLVQSLDALIASQQLFEPEQRLRHLTAFEPALANVYELLAAHYSQLTHPLDDATWQLAELQRRLYWSLAQGYKSVIAELLQQKLSRRAAGVVTISLSKALKALTRVLGASCRFYLDPPTGLWADLHQLFRLAERCNFSALDPAVVTDLDTPIQDPVRVYKKALLFWLANPYQMTAQERDQLGRLIDICQENCHIFCPVEFADDTPMLFVDLSSDMPPAFSCPIDSIMRADTRVIDTTVLVTLLHQYQSMARENISQHDLTGLRLATIQPPVRNRALQAWSHYFQRTQSRHDCAHEVHITVGLAATHHFAQNRQLALNPPESTPHSPDVPLLTVRHRKKKVSTTIPPAPSYQSHHGRLFNQSPRGGCITGEATPALRLQVGELIGLFHCQQNTQIRLTLAVVRWLKNSGSGHITFGIEFLANEPTPVSTRVCNPNAPYSDYLQSFLLSGNSKNGNPTTLLTSRVPFKSGDLVGVNWKEHDTRLILRNELTTTSRFARFAFETEKDNKCTTEDSKDSHPPQTST